MHGEYNSSTHPPLPPTTEDDRVSVLRLLRSRRVGPTTFHRLIAEHGSAAAALVALPYVARAAGVAKYEICPKGVVLAEIKAARLARARMICIGDADYPAHLASIDDAPPVLWAIGDTSLLSRPMVGLIGARNCSSLGTRMAKKLGHDLAEAGINVVSGMARGIDGAAHLGAGSKNTIAVLGGGVDVIYPNENAELYRDIAKNGLLLSEQPMGQRPHPGNFPARNRIVSGLSRAVVVIEAAAKSGSLITARMALDQGRDVMAVPGHPFDNRSWGCNMLIRDGALLVRGAYDIIEAIGVQAEPETEPTFVADPLDTPQTEPADLNDTAPNDTAPNNTLIDEILSRLGPSPMAEDQLMRDLSSPISAITPALIDLELDGKIIRSSGGLLALANEITPAK